MISLNIEKKEDEMTNSLILCVQAVAAPKKRIKFYMNDKQLAESFTNDEGYCEAGISFKEGEKYVFKVEIDNEIEEKEYLEN